MPGGLTLLASTNADIPTPASGKVTIFFSLDSGVPSYKNDAGVVSPLGTNGATGATGPQGPTSFGLDNDQYEPAIMPMRPTVKQYTITGVVIDGGGVAITTGVKGYIQIPIACTIIKATLLADVAGNIVVDIWKDTYTNYPPVVGDSITAAAKPTLSGTDKSEDATLTGWNTTINAGDVLGFNVDSAATVTRVTLELTVSY